MNIHLRKFSYILLLIQQAECIKSVNACCISTEKQVFFVQKKGFCYKFSSFYTGICFFVFQNNRKALSLWSIT